MDSGSAPSVRFGMTLSRWNSRAGRALPCRHLRQGAAMTVSIANLQPIVALIAGVLILIMPRLLISLSRSI
jgi:hypothetical protein